LCKWPSDSATGAPRDGLALHLLSVEGTPRQGAKRGCKGSRDVSRRSRTDCARGPAGVGFAPRAGADRPLYRTAGRPEHHEYGPCLAVENLDQDPEPAQRPVDPRGIVGCFLSSNWMARPPRRREDNWCAGEGRAKTGPSLAAASATTYCVPSPRRGGRKRRFWRVKLF
jgi:hypothetical protein